MKKAIILLLVLVKTLFVVSQPSNISNSFEEMYKTTHPAIHYVYDETAHIHNYSHNWDFDNDGIHDEVYFVGTGGAHAYYFLRVILSSDRVVRNFPYLISDFPILPSGETVTQFNCNPQKTYFAVFSIDNSNAVFIRLDTISFALNKKILKRQGVKTNAVVVTFTNNTTMLNDFDRKKNDEH
jgi:hypothetical protein